jgi:YbgC/YbaW family acyl-CoA thioester hydrolase
MTSLLHYRIVARFRDCDPLGHINNAVYLTYLEQTRFVLWQKQLGFVARSASDAGRRGVGFILARVEIDYVSQARYGDELEVRVTLARRRRHGAPGRQGEHGAGAVRLRRAAFGGD